MPYLVFWLVHDVTILERWIKVLSMFYVLARQHHQPTTVQKWRKAGSFTSQLLTAILRRPLLHQGWKRLTYYKPADSRSTLKLTQWTVIEFTTITAWPVTIIRAFVEYKNKFLLILHKKEQSQNVKQYSTVLKSGSPSNKRWLPLVAPPTISWVSLMALRAAPLSPVACNVTLSRDAYLQQDNCLISVTVVGRSWFWGCQLHRQYNWQVCYSWDCAKLCRASGTLRAAKESGWFFVSTTDSLLGGRHIWWVSIPKRSGQ